MLKDSSVSIPALAKKNERLLSLDALRGFDMLWIVGLDDVFNSVMKLLRYSSWMKQKFQNAGYGQQWKVATDWMAEQSDHVKWSGFHAYDLILPMFVFIMGAAIPLAIFKHLENGDSRRQIYFHTLRRVIILILLGIVYNGGLRLLGFEQTRFASVLGFIGITYGFSTLIVMHFNIKAQVLWMVGILAVYALAIEVIPPPHLTNMEGIQSWHGMLSAWVDQHFLPGMFYKEHVTTLSKAFDPEGILPMISGVSIALLGSLTGEWIRKTNKTGNGKALGLFFGGCVFLTLGFLWSMRLPIIKSVWTPSFVLVAGGWCLLHLSLFYWVLDVRGWRKLGFPLAVVGANAILIYLLSEIVNFTAATQFLLGGIAMKMGHPWDDLIVACGILGVEWLLLYFLWKQKVFFKI